MDAILHFQMQFSVWTNDVQVIRFHMEFLG